MGGARSYYDRIEHGQPGVADPEFVRWLLRYLGPCLRLWFRPSLDGTEHLPDGEPYLLVANHSGGGVAEVLCFIVVWWEHFGLDRPIAGFAHPLAFRLPVMSKLHDKLGVIPSTYAAADRAIADGVPLLVFPGGDYEGYRPLWQAKRVDFGGRKGFVKIAQKHHLPIVPLAIRGSHWTNPILWRSELMSWVLIWPRLFGVKRVPLTLLALLVCVATAWFGAALGGPGLALLFGWASFTLVPASFAPWVPSRIRMSILPAIDPASIGGEADAVYSRVVCELQRAVLD